PKYTPPSPVKPSGHDSMPPACGGGGGASRSAKPGSVRWSSCMRAFPSFRLSLPSGNGRSVGWRAAGASGLRAAGGRGGTMAPSTLPRIAMLINCVAYQHGRKLADIGVADIPRHRGQPGVFVWVALQDATAEEMTARSESTRLNSSHVKISY